MADQIPESTLDRANRAKWLARLRKRKQSAVPESNATKKQGTPSLVLTIHRTDIDS